MIRICWIQHASEWPLVEQVVNFLKSANFEVKMVNTTLDIHERYLQDGLESYFISEIINSREILSEDELIALDWKYGFPGIKAVCNSDVHLAALFGKNESKKEQVVGQAFKFWESFFQEHETDCVIARETAYFSTRTAYAVARRKNLPFYLIDVAPGVFTDDYFVLCDVGEKYVWSDLISTLSNKEKKISDNKKGEILNFLQKCEEKITQPLKIRFIPPPIIKSLRNLIGMTLRINSKERRKKDPIGVAALIFGRKKLLNRLIWKYITQPFFSYDKPHLNEKFIYFPLYSRKEAMSLTLDHYWALNEISLIKYVASSLPKGYWLYVKEHPNNPGEFSFSELRDLKKLNNIKVIFPSFSSPVLIKASQAVVVMQGAVGWEAFLMRKPIINLGSSLYSYSSLVYNVSSISNLPYVLWQAIRVGSKIYDNNEGDWFWFIQAAISTFKKGIFCRLFSPPYGFPLEPENSKKIADSIAQKIKRDLSHSKE